MVHPVRQHQTDSHVVSIKAVQKISATWFPSRLRASSPWHQDECKRIVNVKSWETLKLKIHGDIATLTFISFLTHGSLVQEVILILESTKVDNTFSIGIAVERMFFPKGSKCVKEKRQDCRTGAVALIEGLNCPPALIDAEAKSGTLGQAVRKKQRVTPAVTQVTKAARLTSATAMSSIR